MKLSNLSLKKFLSRSSSLGSGVLCLVDTADAWLSCAYKQRSSFFLQNYKHCCVSKFFFPLLFMLWRRSVSLNLPICKDGQEPKSCWTSFSDNPSHVMSPDLNAATWFAEQICWCVQKKSTTYTPASIKGTNKLRGIWLGCIEPFGPGRWFLILFI